MYTDPRPPDQITNGSQLTLRPPVRRIGRSGSSRRVSSEGLETVPEKDIK